VRREVFWKAAANGLSASRFVLAGLWMAAYAPGDRRAAVLGPIALAAAASDFADGRLARRAGSVDQFGRWLDAIADITYIPVLIALSFVQYALDSVVILGSSVPVASRLGHWGGAFNYILVTTLAFAAPPRLPGRIIQQAAPLIGLLYLAAIIERALNYRRSRFMDCSN
jgi:phosphatidylglycerophosphate synthase